MIRLVFAEPAERDLEDILTWIARENPAAARKVFDEIVATTQRLTVFPDLGRAGRLPDTRECPVRSLPFVITYQRTDATITVLAVFHGARNLPAALQARREELARPDTTDRRTETKKDES